MGIEAAYLDLGRLDRLSFGDTVIHRLDPRAKVIATILFAAAVVSFPRYEVFSLVPFFLFPAVTSALGDVPLPFIARKTAAAAPFALFVGIFNPLLDRAPVALPGGLSVAAGWISFASILLRFVLTVGAALLLVATTSFPGICRALRRLGVPAAFVTQLLFLYRYLFLFVEEAARAVRGARARSFGAERLEARFFVRIAGTLLWRTVERAERIHAAMAARGFRGEVPAVRADAFGTADAVYLVAWTTFFALCRFLPVPELVGRAVRGLLA